MRNIENNTGQYNKFIADKLIEDYSLRCTEGKIR